MLEKSPVVVTYDNNEKKHFLTMSEVYSRQYLRIIEEDHKPAEIKYFNAENVSFRMHALPMISINLSVGVH